VSRGGGKESICPRALQLGEIKGCLILEKLLLGIPQLG